MTWIVEFDDNYFTSSRISVISKTKCISMIDSGSLITFEKDDFIIGESNKIRKIKTFDRTKGEKYGMHLPDPADSSYMRHDHYSGWVFEKSIRRIKRYIDRFFVMYKGHFFSHWDTNLQTHEVHIGTSSHYIGDKFGIKIDWAELKAGFLPGYHIWVDESEIQQLSSVSDRIGYYHYYVVYIDDEDENNYWIRTDDYDRVEPFVKGCEFIPKEYEAKGVKKVKYEVISHTHPSSRERKRDIYPEDIEELKIRKCDLWEKKENWYYKVVPKDDVFVYNESNEPLRY